MVRNIIVVSTFIITHYYYVCLVQLKRDQYAFFPLNRALCLASLDDEAAESKLDTVAEDVSFLVRQHHDGVRAFCFFYYPPEVSSIKYCCLEVFRKEYFRLVTK